MTETTAQAQDSQALFESMFDHKPKIDTRTPAETDPRSPEYLPIYFKETT